MQAGDAPRPLCGAVRLFLLRFFVGAHPLAYSLLGLSDVLAHSLARAPGVVSLEYARMRLDRSVAILDFVRVQASPDG